jgi:hypothetical protein
VFTRNEVVFNQECADYVRSIQKNLTQFKNSADDYILGKPKVTVYLLYYDLPPLNFCHTFKIALVETLQAEVRSKFQTKKQMEYSAQGFPVEVLFDDTVVRYNWVEERKFEIIEIILASQDKTRADALKNLVVEDEAAAAAETDEL